MPSPPDKHSAVSRTPAPDSPPGSGDGLSLTPAELAETGAPAVFAHGSTFDASGADALAETGPPEPSTRVVADRFEVRACLGRGAFGAVYRAFDRVSHDDVAIKVIPVASPELAERVRRELRSARQVTHLNVVRLYDILESDGELVLSMELVLGPSLEGWMREHADRPPADVQRMAREMCAGVAAAHAAGIVHRDLKPANILMRPASGSCVVADFGIARSANPDEAMAATRSGAVMGTPLYMAPEQLQGCPDVGPRADVYAIGLILYELATGRMPHEATNYAQLYDARASGRFPEGLAEDDETSTRPLLPATLRRILRLCLATRPDERYADARELLTAFDEAEVPTPSTQDTMALASSIAKPALPPAGRRWRQRLGLGLSVGALGVAFVVGWGEVERRGWLSGRDELAPPLKVAVIEPPPDAEHWLDRAATQLVATHLQAWSSGYELVAEGDSPDLFLAFDAKSANGHVSLDVLQGPARDRLAVVLHKDARNLGEVSSFASSALREQFSTGRQPREPGADEMQQMAAVAAESLPAWLRYRYALHTSADDYLEDVASLDPGWAHLHAARLYLAAMMSRQLPPVPSVDADRDPVGARLLEVLGDDAVRLNPEAVRKALPDGYCPDTDELCLLVRTRFAGLSDERVLVAARRACGTGFKNSDACAQVAELFERSGMDENLRRFLDDWLLHDPAGQPAIVEWAVAAIDRGEASVASRAAVMLRAIDDEFTLASQCALHAAEDDLDTAAQAAVNLMSQPKKGDLGRYSLAMILAVRGELGRALALFQVAADGLYRDQSMEAIIDIQEGLGLRAKAAATIDAWLASDRPPKPLSALTRRFQRDLLLRRPKARASSCPSIETFLAEVDDPFLHALVAQALRRLAADHGCLPCADVLADGTSGYHRVSSNVAFARCAAAENQFTLAERVLSGVRTLRLPAIEPSGLPSPYSLNIARLELARVFAAQGKTADALRELDAIILRWEQADRPIPQLPDAQRLARNLRATSD